MPTRMLPLLALILLAGAAPAGTKDLAGAALAGTKDLANAALAGAKDASRDLSGLLAWVGCYPSCNRFTRPRGLRPPPRPDMLAHPPLRAVLDRMLGPGAVAAMAADSTVQSPVDRRGDWIATGGCRQHDCDMAGYALFVNLATRQVLLCRTLKRAVEGRTVNDGALYRSDAPPAPPEGCERAGAEQDNWGILARILARGAG